ncbi:MAG: inosine/xanthosine triphosphatase [bacterium]|nr:inosine/xanthosine triphosphatase [bacterium]
MERVVVNVGSLNRIKRRAVEEACRELFGGATVRPFRTDSGVSHTPATDDEIIEGAARRAAGAFGEGGADFGVGLEGGVAQTPHGPILKGWVAVFDGTRTFIGATPGLPLPASVMEKVRGGRELAHLMEEMTGVEDVRSKQGAFGVLTGNRITRLQSFKLALYCAFAPVVNGKLYAGEAR